mgnify:CR=1 FL=1
MDKKIAEICGFSEITPDFEMIGNNPNFVFENDPNFDTVILFDTNNNIINVNSWLECANYVNGGWINNSVETFNGEQFIFFVTLSLFIIYFSFKKFVKRGVK